MLPSDPSNILTFRPAGDAEIDLIRTLADRIWRESYVAMLSPTQIDYMLAWMYGAERIRGEMQAGVIWEVAEIEGNAVGYLSVTIHDTSIAELNKLYLLPDRQGHGWGQVMLARVETIATERDCATLRLRVNKTNARALKAYHRAGFETVDALVADIGGGFVMDDYVLARSLHPAV